VLLKRLAASLLLRCVRFADYAEGDWSELAQKPLLYNGAADKRPKPSLVEMVLYNMASMMAGVGAGYDVRVANASALHPKLHPDRSLHNY